jgi:hypothetical protein
MRQTKSRPCASSLGDGASIVASGPRWGGDCSGCEGDFWEICAIGLRASRWKPDKTRRTMRRWATGTKDSVMPMQLAIVENTN